MFCSIIKSVGLFVAAPTASAAVTGVPAVTFAPCFTASAAVTGVPAVTGSITCGPPVAVSSISVGSTEVILLMSGPGSVGLTPPPNPVGKPLLTPAINSPPCATLPMPEARPPTAPPIRADLNASFRLPPWTNVPIPDPKAPAAIVPKPGNMKFKPTERMTGASFLKTLTTPLTAFLMPLNIFFRKNSGWPVTGLMLFSSLPTT